MLPGLAVHLAIGFLLTSRNLFRTSSWDDLLAAIAMELLISLNCDSSVVICEARAEGPLSRSSVGVLAIN